MIQRIQSIYLFIASAAFFLLFVLGFLNTKTASDQIFADKVFNVQDNIGLIVLTTLGGAVALLNIFLFSNRKLQINLGKVLIALSLAIPAVGAFLLYQEGLFNNLPKELGYGAGLAMPLIALVTSILANRSIKKDDKLVRSMDRLR